MSLKGFINGEGPFYRLTGARPASAGIALMSTADADAEWGPLATVALPLNIGGQLLSKRTAPTSWLPLSTRTLVSTTHSKR